MTVVPVNVAVLKKQLLEDSRSMWKTEEGWVYPGVKSTAECNKHAKKPDPAREDELTQVGYTLPTSSSTKNCSIHMYWDIRLIS